MSNKYRGVDYIELPLLWEIVKLPATVEFNVNENFGEAYMDMLQDGIEREALDTWLNSVNGNNALGVGIKDSRYVEELSSTDIITRENTPFQCVSIFQGGPVAEQYENGVQQFDLKPGLLQGKNVKITKDGVKYNTVPFRHGATSQESGHFKAMPKGLHKLVGRAFEEGEEHENSSYHVKHSLKGFTTKEKGGMKPFRTDDIHYKGNVLPAQRGQRLTGFKSHGREVKVIKPSQSGGKIRTYKWKTGRYEGMIRQEKEYGAAIQSEYTTFRRVSDNSDPSSWIHPGFPKKPILQALANYIETKIIPLNMKEITENLAQGEI